MAYYSKKLFVFFTALYFLTFATILYYWKEIANLAGFATMPYGEVEYKNLLLSTNTFFIVVLTLVIFSYIILLLQQMIYKRVGYIMIIPALTYLFAVFYLLINGQLFGVLNLIFRFSVFPDNVLGSIMGLILFLSILMPGYVIIRLVKEDFINKKR